MNRSVKIHSRLCLAVVYVLLSFFAVSQTAKDDLTAMSKVFAKLTAFDMNVDIKVYKNEKDASPSFTSKGRTAKSDGKFYLSMLNKKTILNNKLLLVIDDQQKLLMYSRLSDDQIKLLTANQTINIDSIISSNPAEISYVVNNANEKKIIVKSNTETIKSIVISMDPKTYVLTEIVYSYATEDTKVNSKVIVRYSNFAFEAKDTQLFSQSKYIKSGKKITATPAYKNYRIINTEDYSKQR